MRRLESWLEEVRKERGKRREKVKRQKINEDGRLWIGWRR